MQGLEEKFGYPEALFEVYMPHAVEAGGAATDTAPDPAELIRGLERLDMAGHGGDFVAQKVLSEAKLILNALQAARVPADALVVFPGTVLSPQRDCLGAGWNVTRLESAPSYSGGRVTEEENPQVLLSQSGGLYVYRSAPEKPADDPVDGLVFNRYAPVCSTRMHDRSILYGFAALAAHHDLDLRPQSAAA